MKITLQCPVCKSYYENNPDSKRWGIEYDIFYNSDSSITLIDDFRRGHFCVVYFTNYKFDLLFESGLSAIHDLYFREAVASIASSLERFYQYCIEIMTLNLDNEKYSKLWKTISNQSERQIGAFYFLFFKTFNAIPQFLSDNETSFRNKVIHKGYFPSKDETFDFTKRVYAVIESNYQILTETFSEKISIHKQQNAENLLKNASKFAKTESKHYEKHCVFEVNPYKRNIDTFLYVEEKFKKKNIESIEEYIMNLKNKRLD
jgi:hypothetical protein